MPISQNRARRARTRRFTPGLETLERREVFSVTPYLLAVAPSVQITPIMTVGDSVAEADAATDMFDNGTTPQDGQYRMAGLPDGLGAFDNGDDLIKNMQLWNGTSYVSGTTVLNRLCSADLPEVSAFYNAATGKGTTTRIFMDDEETSAGRAFAHLASGPNAGTSYQLPALGARAHENVVANPKAQDATVIIGTDIEKAGLTNGVNYAIQVAGVNFESRDFGLATSGPNVTATGTFSLVAPGSGGTQVGRSRLWSENRGPLHSALLLTLPSPRRTEARVLQLGRCSRS